MIVVKVFLWGCAFSSAAICVGGWLKVRRELRKVARREAAVAAEWAALKAIVDEAARDFAAWEAEVQP